MLQRIVKVELCPTVLVSRSFVTVLLSFGLVACGGGGGGAASAGSTGGTGTGSSPAGSPTFSLSAPSSITVTPNSAQTVAVALSPENGFSGAVNITITGLPAGVAVSPATFTLTPGFF